MRLRKVTEILFLAKNTVWYRLKLADNIIGNFHLEKTIGEGTFGKVYLGTHLPTKEKVDSLFNKGSSESTREKQNKRRRFFRKSESRNKPFEEFKKRKRDSVIWSKFHFT